MEGSFEAGGQFVRRSPASIVEEDYDRSRIGHVVMNRHHLKAVPAQSLKGRCNLTLKHRDIASYGSIFISTNECCPGVEPHASIDGCSHLFHIEVVTSDGDFVNRSILLAFVPHDFRNARRIQGGFSRSTCWVSSRGAGGYCVPNQVYRL